MTEASAEKLATVLATDTKYKAVSYVESYTGRMVFPRDPKPEYFTIIDIAHHLSNDCRYSGATEVFFSTAQHCCLLCDYVMKVRKGTPLDGIQILMHDGAEAYLRDIPRPIKQFLPDYRTWDYNLTMSIRSWLGLSGVPIPSWQDELDSRIIADERAQLMSDSGNDWQHNVEPLGINIDPWGSRAAEQQFLMRYASLSKLHFGTPQYLRSGWGLPTDATFQPFRTGGSDVMQYGETDAAALTDLVEVDLRGGVGRVPFRSPDGMMIRDTKGGQFPRPAWRWLHGNFTLTNTGVDNGLGA